MRRVSLRGAFFATIAKHPVRKQSPRYRRLLTCTAKHAVRRTPTCTCVRCKCVLAYGATTVPERNEWEGRPSPSSSKRDRRMDYSGTRRRWTDDNRHVAPQYGHCYGASKTEIRGSHARMKFASSFTTSARHRPGASVSSACSFAGSTFQITFRTSSIRFMTSWFQKRST